MKRLIIICEGETEQEMSDKILRPYFQIKDFVIECPLIKKSMGGIVSWPALKAQIQGHLKEHAYVTTFIDYYGIKDRHQFPCWMESKDMTNKYDRIRLIEDGMKIDVNRNHMFLPYIQLHEFEALLFNNMESFSNVLPEEELMDKTTLENVLDTYSNPEMIDDGIETSPSHRLKLIIPAYDKVLYGYYLAEEIGIERMRDKCPHFNDWLTRIEGIK